MKSDGVMIGFSRKPRLTVDRSRTYRAHDLVLRPGGARAADRANELAVKPRLSVDRSRTYRAPGAGRLTGDGSAEQRKPPSRVVASPKEIDAHE